MPAEAELRAELQALRGRLAALEQRLDADLADEALPVGSFEVVICGVGHERVALRLDQVEEVVPVAEMSALPEAPPWVCGLLDVRGTVMPVIDVLARVQRRVRVFDLEDLVVVCSLGERPVGLVVQQVFDVERVDADEVQRDVADLPHGPYLLGAFRRDEQVRLLFGIGRLIASSELPEAEAVAEAAAAARRQEQS